MLPAPGGYELRVNDPAASLADYLAAMEGAEERLGVPRQRRAEGPCRGCHSCCHERAPLTSVDVLLLQEAMRREGMDLPWHQVLQRLAWVEVQGAVVDITLRRLPEGACSLLDRAEGACLRHPFRPLVCRTYICCRPGPAARRLRELAINAGEDDLVRRWLLDAKARPAQLYMHQAEEPRVDLADWPANAFSGKKTYGEISLRLLCDGAFWQDLTAPQGKI